MSKMKDFRAKLSLGAAAELHEALAERDAVIKRVALAAALTPLCEGAGARCRLPSDVVASALVGHFSIGEDGRLLPFSDTSALNMLRDASGNPLAPCVAAELLLRDRQGGGMLFTDGAESAAPTKPAPRSSTPSKPPVAREPPPASDAPSGARAKPTDAVAIRRQIQTNITERRAAYQERLRAERGK